MDLTTRIEAVLFVSPDPVSVDRLCDVLEYESEQILGALKQLRNDYEQRQSGIRLVAVAGGYQLRTAPDAHDIIADTVHSPSPELSTSQLETLAIIAYRQPVTRTGVESIRGVSAQHVLSVLVDSGLIRAVGRQNTPGRPILYGTTDRFMQHLGISSLDELPPLEEAEDKG